MHQMSPSASISEHDSTTRLIDISEERAKATDLLATLPFSQFSLGEMAASDGHVPPAAVAKEAQRGLDLRAQHGRGGIGPGQARARQLTSGQPMKLETIKRMKAYFDRHEVDKQGKDWDNAEHPSNGKIAWLLWGGDAGRTWANKICGQEAATVNDTDYARNIEEQLAALRGLGAETAAPVMSPLDPNFNDAERINVPEDHATTSYFKVEDAPNFEGLSKQRAVLLLRQQWVELQQAERVLYDNFEQHRALFLQGITSKPAAIQATRAITPGLIRTLPLTFSQMNALLRALTDQVKLFGVQAPENWLTATESIHDDEDGDDES